MAASRVHPVLLGAGFYNSLYTYLSTSTQFLFANIYISLAGTRRVPHIDGVERKDETLNVSRVVRVFAYNSEEDEAKLNHRVNWKSVLDVFASFKVFFFPNRAASCVRVDKQPINLTFMFSA